jgi:hypothetical protein
MNKLVKIKKYLLNILRQITAKNKARKSSPIINKEEAKIQAFSDMMSNGINPYILKQERALKEFLWDY